MFHNSAIGFDRLAAYLLKIFQSVYQCLPFLGCKYNYHNISPKLGFFSGGCHIFLGVSCKDALRVKVSLNLSIPFPN